MTLEEQLGQLAKQTYPVQVDVVDKVMATVMQHPYLQRPSKKTPVWKYITSGAAAAVVIAVVLNVSVTYSRSYDVEQIGSMLAMVDEYNTYGDFQTVEDAAVNPIEMLYYED